MRERPLDFNTLKAKQRQLRDAFDSPLGLRVHRAISWLQAAENASARSDLDLAFICCWVSFNAGYAQGTDLHQRFPEREFFGWYFEQVVRLDREGEIYHAIWNRFSETIRTFVNNRFVFYEFWRHQHGEPDFADWEKHFDEQRRSLYRAVSAQNTPRILGILFNRLYTLRNQLMHGGATWQGGVNREQVANGAAIMAVLVPEFINLMMEHPGEAWGAPPFPVLG